MTVGKSVGRHTYIHVTALPEADDTTRCAVALATEVLSDHENAPFNVVRMESGSNRVGLLDYPDFFEDAFPALRASWVVDPDVGLTSYRTYEDSLNPPILHRKELLLAGSHPERSSYESLTRTAEELGLFAQPARIGFRNQWNSLVAAAGYEVVGHRLAPLGNDEGSESATAPGEAVSHAPSKTEELQRHLTALVRRGFSAPIQSLDRFELLRPGSCVFDYGCGRGDDLRGLVDNGYQAAGWDPHYAPEQPLVEADIVNLGFVINVIDDFDERVEAVRKSYALARELLVVSAMLTSRNATPGRPYKDGMITQRGTFQKYYSQSELQAFIGAVLDEEPVAVGPGVFYVFRDKTLEQRFLAARSRSHRAVLRHRSLTVTRDPRSLKERRAAELFAQHTEKLECVWERWLDLGRTPAVSEVADVDELIETFGSFKRVLNFLSRHKGSEALVRAAAERRADLEVYFALALFEQRKKYTSLEPRIQTDVKSLFGSYSAARQASQRLLYQIASPENIAVACRQAHEKGLGSFEEGEGLQLHASLISQLSPVLRVYVGAAAALYGDHRTADLIKIHQNCEKLSLMRFDDFSGRALPRMLERVKVNLRDQTVDYYTYEGEYTPPYLYGKSRFINEEFDRYPEQLEFDSALEEFSWLDLQGYGPSPREFDEALRRHRYEVEGFGLERTKELPDLDDACGEYLKFKDLIECGETQRATAIANVPKHFETYGALVDLATQILDPVIDYFGMIELTYGFCSPELARQVPGGVAPKLDQHASHERNRRGNLVCDRLGAAADFLVRDEDMREVAEWVAEHTPFDRIYFYGEECPIHVSVGPQHKRAFVVMELMADGRRIPKVRKS
ncbi:MAG: DNA phosphorothioation-associated putative methyltransferase [Gammaproteobacteria bacterium]|nr:DNA phosphorothioation-associated putative methyltransferase [Gammaproteobacteria bacterium]